MDIRIEDAWKLVLKKEFGQLYFEKLTTFIDLEKAAGKTIFPPEDLIFNAFSKTPFDDVRVVILGQDPYHRAGQAMGLSFSVPVDVRIPPSLKNIYKELHRDIGFEIPDHGDLSSWSEQGVFLLNAFLTVEEGKAGSHQKIGWQQFTDSVIRLLSEKKQGVVFLLWGRFAQAKAVLIDDTKHHVLTAFHPSPLARNRFQGCGHFSETNRILKEQGLEPINWNLD